MAEQNPPENDIAKKKCSELRKGDRALIFSPLAEILAAFPYNDDLVYIRCRNAVSGGIFEVKWQASKEVDIPKLNRTDYRLLDIYPDTGELALMNDEGIMNELVKLPKDEMGEDLRKLFDADKDVRVTVIEAWGEEGVESFKEAVRE